MASLLRRVLGGLLALTGTIGGAQAAPDPQLLAYPALTPQPDHARAVPGALLFSDSPERPGRAGLLYRDDVSGMARVVAYHENGLGVPARVLLLAAPTAGSARVGTLRRGAARTSGPDPLIGQQTLLRFFASGPPLPQEPEERPLGGPEVIYRSPPLPPGAVFSLMTDLLLSGPVQLSVLIVPDGTPSDPAALLALPILARDANHQRGTFPEAERPLRLDLGPAGLPARLTLGDDAMSGVDALTGDPQRLAGNFGLTYDLLLSLPPGTRITAVPRGGPYRGVAQLQDGDRAPAPLLLGQGAALKNYTTPAPLWTARSGSVRLQLVPSPGSWLPLALVFYPPRSVLPR